jgi:cellulose synthase/poly-beta-1,6-N-acetylglucosamine synthase-like glycosyltransferase
MILKLVDFLQWFFLAYMLCLGLLYLTLNFISIFSIVKHMGAHRMDYFLDSFSEFLPPISLLVPAYNEAATIEVNIRSLMQLIYSEYEVIIINDGSTDNTLAILTEAFDLKPLPQAYPVRIPVENLKGFYQSGQYPNLHVIDKENGGKADALNAGINASRYPLFCSIDADSILQRDSLTRIVQPFINDSLTVAAGGTIRIINGSTVKDGMLLKADLPARLLARMQIVEYLRAFLFGRLGWTPMNAMLVISGAFGLFKKQVVLDAGGYKKNTLGEDMELVVRLHLALREKNIPYRITFVPDPICWTEVPEDLKSLRSQRVRWQKGLFESLLLNMSLLFHPKGGIVGWVAFPVMLIFELLGPVIEVMGYLFVIIGLALGFVSITVFLMFFLLSIGLGMLISVTSLLLEELSFHLYTTPKQVRRLFYASIIENFGYRQLVSIWRLEGLFGSLLRKKHSWGNIIRNADWHNKKHSGK